MTAEDFPGYARPYWEALAEGRVVLPTCHGCGQAVFPPAPRCPDCGQTAFDWREPDPVGTVYTLCTTHRSFGDVGALGSPYTVLLVALAPRARVFGVTAEPITGRAAIGRRARLDGVVQDGELRCPRFVLIA